MSSYHVGNSLTYQTGLNHRLPQLAAERGETHVAGQHIRCGQSLDYIWNNPTETCVTPGPFGTYGEALPDNSWDAVTLQPYRDSLEAAQARVGDFIGLAQSDGLNGDTRFYVYTGWAQNLDGVDYSTRYVEEYDGTRDTTWTRDYYSQLLPALQAEYGMSVGIVPVAEVLFELDQMAQAGELPGVADVDDWYTDPYHLNSSGNYVGLMTLYATLHGESPVGLGPSSGVPEELVPVIQQVAWSVVESHPYTLVPEPGSLGALALGTLALLRRRR